MGLRETKKAKTRKMISDLATELFVEKGYAAVTVAEIAEKAEVSVTTLFNYFPTKETLVFDEDKEREKNLINAVVTRKSGASILNALEDFLLKSSAFNSVRQKGFAALKQLIQSTPELSSYERQVWMRYEQSLADVIQKEAARKIGRVEAEIVAHFVLDAFHRVQNAPKPQPSLKAAFRILKEGWKESAAG